MGAPGEKGPNGLPVSMAVGPITFGAVQQLGPCTEILPGETGGSFCGSPHKEPHLSQEETRFLLQMRGSSICSSPTCQYSDSLARGHSDCVNIYLQEGFSFPQPSDMHPLCREIRPGIQMTIIQQ